MADETPTGNEQRATTTILVVHLRELSRFVSEATEHFGYLPGYMPSTDEENVKMLAEHLEPTLRRKAQNLRRKDRFAPVTAAFIQLHERGLPAGCRWEFGHEYPWPTDEIPRLLATLVPILLELVEPGEIPNDVEVVIDENPNNDPRLIRAPLPT